MRATIYRDRLAIDLRPRAQVCFVILAATYFIFVLWFLLYRSKGLDKKCNDPWIGSLRDAGGSAAALL